MDNADFSLGWGREAARILRELAQKIQDEEMRESNRYALYDGSGNTVGEMKVGK